MKVFLFLCFYTLPLLLHAQSALEGSFSPLQELTKIEYRMTEGSAAIRCKLSLSSSGATVEPYGSWEGEELSLYWKTRNFLGKSWSSSSLEIQGLRLSYLYDDEMRKAFYIEGRQGGLAYLLSDGQASLPSVYTWQEKSGKVFCFWEAESPWVNLSLVCSWGEGERFTLSQDISLSEGALSFDWKMDGIAQEQLHSASLAMKVQDLKVMWRMKIQAGPPPVFGGQVQTMERSVYSKMSYTLDALTLESAMESRVRTGIQGEQSERNSLQLTGRWDGYAINVAWSSIQGMSIELDTEKGNLFLSRDGIAFSLLLKRGPLSLTIKKDTKENLSLTYSFRITSYPDSGSPHAR